MIIGIVVGFIMGLTLGVLLFGEGYKTSAKKKVVAPKKIKGGRRWVV